MNSTSIRCCCSRLPAKNRDSCRGHPASRKIANNPFNVYHSWQEFNTTIDDSARIAGNTIIRLSFERPAGRRSGRMDQPGIRGRSAIWHRRREQPCSAPWNDTYQRRGRNGKKRDGPEDTRHCGKTGHGPDYRRRHRAEGADQRQGYLEGESYIITWAIGHLVSLAEPDLYDAKYKKWNFGDLPIIPDGSSCCRIRGRRINCRSSRSWRSAAAALVNACDAGREGQHIFSSDPAVFEAARSRSSGCGSPT